MQLQTILLALAFATQGLASPAGVDNNLEARSCAGSKAGCHTMPVDACKNAEALIDDNHTYFTGGSADDTGVKFNYGGFGTACGIFVEKAGKNKCSLKGSDMKKARDQMVKKGCNKCGEVDWNSDCKVKADYVDGV